jgi:uncharacterized OB-fold protein
VIEAIGTYLPPWGSATARQAGHDEDVVTMAVAAGLAALEAAPSTPVRTVVVVSRDLPLLEGSNAAPVLAGLGLPAHTNIREELGGAPAALDALASAVPGTLVIGSDANASAGAAAALAGDSGPGITVLGRTQRSLPVVARHPDGKTWDYSDPRLLRELGVRVSLEQVGVGGKVTAVAGLAGKDASSLSEGDAPVLPTVGASAALFALAALADRRDGGRLLAVEQATMTLANLASGAIAVHRDEAPAQPPVKLRPGSDAEISISLAAYERAFDPKLRLEAGQCRQCATLAYPPRYRCLVCGSEAGHDLVPLPREAEIYSVATVHVPVPGLETPYTLVLADLGDTGVRLLGRLTGAPPGCVAIGDRGRMVFRRVAMRTGVPDYGYAFFPSSALEVAA